MAEATFICTFAKTLLGPTAGRPLYSNHEAGFFVDKMGGRNSCIFLPKVGDFW